MEVSAVCVDVAAARALVRAGIGVVLMGPDGATLGRAGRELSSAGSGRVAVFVGNPADEADRDAAVAMATEQFGAAAVLVGSPDEASALVRLARPARGKPEQT